MPGPREGQKQLSVFLPTYLHDALLVMAQLQQRSVSSLIRHLINQEAINTYVENRYPPGVIGTALDRVLGLSGRWNSETIPVDGPSGPQSTSVEGDES